MVWRDWVDIADGQESKAELRSARDRRKGCGGIAVPRFLLDQRIGQDCRPHAPDVAGAPSGEAVAAADRSVVRLVPVEDN